MNKLFYTLFFLTVSLCFLSCGDDDGSQETQLRVRNLSTVSLEDVTISTDVGTYDFGNLNSFVTTEYEILSGIPTTLTASVMVNGDPFSETITIEDQATPAYTIELTYVCNGNNCILEVVQE